MSTRSISSIPFFFRFHCAALLSEPFPLFSPSPSPFPVGFARFCAKCVKVVNGNVRLSSLPCAFALCLCLVPVRLNAPLPSLWRRAPNGARPAALGRVVGIEVRRVRSHIYGIGVVMWTVPLSLVSIRMACFDGSFCCPDTSRPVAFVRSSSRSFCGTTLEVMP